MIAKINIRHESLVGHETRNRNDMISAYIPEVTRLADELGLEWKNIPGATMGGSSISCKPFAQELSRENFKKLGLRIIPLSEATDNGDSIIWKGDTYRVLKRQGNTVLVTA